MPKPKYTAITLRKRTYGKPKARKFVRRVYRKKGRGVPRGPGILKNFKRLVRMRYVTFGTITTVAGALNAQLYRCNSIYDPDYSGAGNQPSFHDTYATLWNKYIVVGAKCVTRFYPINVKGATDVTTVPHVVGIKLDDDASTATDYRTLLESENQKFKIHDPTKDIRPTTLVSYFSAKKYFGYKDNMDNMIQYGADFGSNPLEEAYFVVYAQPVNQSSGQTLQHMTVIDYVVLLSEPKDMSAS